MVTSCPSFLVEVGPIDVVNFWSTRRGKETQTVAKRSGQEWALLSQTAKGGNQSQGFSPKSHLTAGACPRRSSLRSLCEFVYH
jgi:hypothetical protein